MTNDDTARLLEVVSRFDTAMLVTHDGRGELRARPLTLADARSDGTLWFFTSTDSGKAFEIERDTRVAVVFESGSRFVSVTGRASLERAHELMRELWHESFRPWFPGGHEDSRAVAVEVTPLAAEVWDLAGVNGLAYEVHALKALISGETASDEPNARYHQKLELRHIGH